MVHTVKEIPEAEEDLHDLEFRDVEDDAWYSVRVVFDSEVETLTVKYHCFPAVQDLIFRSSQFETEEKLEEFVRRFRPLSKQLQDNECGNLKIGTTVCASHAGPNELKFYDAQIDTVIHQKHSFAKGAEECLCEFILFWQHGGPCDTLTLANIVSMCTIVHNFEVDVKISAFAKLVKEKFGFSQNIPQEMEIDKVCMKLTWKGRKINYIHLMSQDDDMGGEPCSTDGWGTCNGQHFILINNIENDLTNLSIKQFIYEETNILPQACVIPSLLNEPIAIARAVIKVECEQKFKILYEFLCNPEHLIVSSRGRPWVIMPISLESTPLWDPIPLSNDMDHDNNSNKDLLHIVYSGTGSFEKAKTLRNLFLEFVNHQKQVFKKLLFEEKKILQPFQSD